MSDNKYVKNDPMYDEPSDFEEQKVLEARRQRKKRGGRKVPTSVALDPELVAQIKAVAEEKGVPYQVLLRMFIIDGFKKFDKTA